MDQRDVDVCVVGAGFAGLGAARLLAQAGKSVALVEARNRVGGRTMTRHLADGTEVDLGGTFIGPGEDRIYAIAEELGVEIYPAYDEGEGILIGDDGKTTRFQGGIPFSGIGFVALATFGLGLAQLDEMAKELPLDAPWEGRHAKEWDAQSVASWASAGLNVPDAKGRVLLGDLIGGFFTSRPDEVSLLHALYLMHASRGTEKLLATKGGVLQDRINGGLQGLAERIAARLGDGLLLQSPVRSITQDADGVTVQSDDLTVRARHAIVAMAATLAGQIRYDPPLSADRMQLTQRVPNGAIIRVVAVYDEPFWRADGLSGHAMAPGATVPYAIDQTTKAGKPGMLATYAVGPTARAISRVDATERRATFLKGLARWFGPKALTPIDYLEHDWTTDVWSQGGMIAHYPPGVLTEFGPALRAPVGRLHWANAETPALWHGQIEGAIRSGEQAAEDVLARG